MSKIRVHELAKELNKSSKDVIYALKGHGVDVESHMSTISSENADKIRKFFTQPAAKPAQKQETKPAQDNRNAAPRRNNNVQGGMDSRGNYSTPSRDNGSRDGQNRGYNRDGQNRNGGRDGQNRSFNRDGNGQNRSFNRDGNGQNRNFNRDGNGQNRSFNRDGNGQNRSFNRDGNGQNRSFNRDGNGQNRSFNRDGNGQNRSFNRDGNGQNRSFNRDGNGQNRSFNRDGNGQNRSFNRDGNGQNRSFNRDGNGQNRSFNRDGNGQNRSFNRDGNGQNRSFNRDGNGQNRSFNRDGNGQNRSFNRDGNGQNRSFNRDGNGQNRSFNRDGNGQNRSFNRDGNGQNRSFNRDGNGQNRSFNRDGNGQNRSFNRDGNGQNRSFNRDGNGQNRNFNRDGNGQNRNGSRDNRGQGGRNGGRDGKFNLDSAINKEVVMTKDTTRENRRNYKDNKDRDNRRDDRDFEGRNTSRNGKNNNKNNNNNNNRNTMRKKPVNAQPKPEPVVEKVTSIELPETVTIKELADKMKIPAAQIIKKLFLEGKMLNVNSDITYDEAEEIALEYDILCEHEVVVDVIEEMLKEEEENEEDLQPRPPVVCVMGHVDHGKTSILDAIRKTSVTSGEAGGITQHIGAYVVEVSGQKITFLDTPGHEAFTAMRLRGAQSTDIAILVVAADDGVMPQTIEAINHAKAAEIDIIVAINKIDKPSANIDRVKQELTEYGLIAEDWGGTTIMVPVSAHTGEGLQDLLDMILLDAEVKELKANPNRKGRGLILEAQLDKGRGPVATVLVQKGTLNVGDNVTVGTAFGKIRAMIDDKGRRVKKAGPSTPVEILGLNEVPQAGEVFIATDTEKEARTMAETFIATKREKMLADTKSKLSLDGLFDQIQAGQIKDLNIIVKADVQGSVEAVKQSLAKLSNDEVAVKVIHGGVGAINESDVTLASASNAIIIGFNVRPDNQAKIIAEQEKVDLRLYRVIYNAIEDIEAAMKGMLEPTFEEKIIGHAEVRQTYKVSGVGTIIGGYVQDGKIVRNCKVRLLRDNVVIHEGELASLKRFKDDVKEVNSGYECGMSFEKYNDIKEGDQIEAFVMEEVPR
ncbi:translation initiation factor IF-2 [Coprococcus catus]|uniref:Translation initiation factor IF-2 n=4 Tax=Coprococcus catus TaxID=116085 RepID=A0A3E2XMN6_9FIRM|nr:translation initiation factor IF-2 [Coprococcus catus]RGC46731.1 translation initiation factor IF-2 [Coprococcus catus]